MEDFRLWQASAEAWIQAQGDEGDLSRREILDPALTELLGDVRGLDVLDVGCGEGRYARKLAALGAKVTGIDPVPEFIAVAQRRHPEGIYREAFAENLPVDDASFDLVLSYLSIIDIPDDAAACAEMVRALRPGGRIVMVTLSNLASTTETWVKSDTGERLYRTVDRYMESFSIPLSWRGITIVNYHRPLSRILGHFLSRGLALTAFLEPLPDRESPMYRDEFRVPTFQILELRRMS